MIKRLLIILSLLMATIPISTAPAAEGLPAEIGGEIAMGQNLTGDNCRLRRIQPGEWGDEAERYALYCEGWSVPSGQVIILGADKRAPAWWLENSGWAKFIMEQGNCEPPQPGFEVGNLRAAVRRCDHRLGWRLLMLTAKTKSKTYIANFLPNNAPLIERTLSSAASGIVGQAAGVVEGKQMASLRKIEELLEEKASMPSIKDIGTLFDLAKLADWQHEARLYRPSEISWMRVLTAQERLFGLDSPPLANTLLRMAYPVRNQRRADDALAYVKRAESIVRKSRDPILKCALLNNLSLDALWRRKYQEAIVFSDQAVASLSDYWPGSMGYLGEAYYSLALAQYQLKDYAAAQRAARESLRREIKARGPDNGFTNRLRMLLAKILIAEKGFKEAESLLQDSIFSAEYMFGQTIWWANAKIVEGSLAQAVGDSNRAMEAYRSFSSVAARERFACFFAPCFSPYADLLITRAGEDPDKEQENLREAFTAVQLFDFPVVSGAINRLAARLSAGDPAIMSFTREQQDLAERHAQLRLNFQGESKKPQKNRSASREDALEKEMHQLQAQMNERELALQDRFPKYAQLMATRPVEAQRIAEVVKSDEALLYLSHVGDKGYTFLLHKNRLSLHVVSLSGEALRRKVFTLRTAMNPGGGSLQPFDTAAAHELYRDLVGPLLDSPGSIRRLIIVPTGPLLSLPPDILVCAPPGEEGKIQWLIRRFSILVVPDVRAILNLRTTAASAPKASGFLGIGNPQFDLGQVKPVLSGQAINAGAAKRSIQIISTAAKSGDDVCSAQWSARGQVAQLAPLPETADELKTTSSLLGRGKTTLLLKENATKANLRRAGMEDRDIITFATHGLLPDDLFCESEPSLALTPGASSGQEDDGLLRASEIAQMRLSASLVILSACSTAGADGRLGGESLSGLVKAFFYAGARNVLATHWPIASQPTVELMKDVAQQKAGGRSWPEALQAGKVKMMDRPATAHPFYWGSFSLVGGD